MPANCSDACRNEVMLMQRLQHPNIVAYKDSFFANGRDNLCIVMTYCDGGDLQGRITDAKSHLIKEDQIMHWFVQIALGIHYMHENKVLHRDIKAQNIFLLGNGRLVLGDLGISKVLDGTVQFASTQIGTPYYMSPELFKNKPYNHKSDVWALGCVLYELCALVHPFDATSLQGLAAKIMKGSYAPINPKYSQSLRSLIASMLAVDPRSRPSVAEVLQQPYLKKHIYNFIKDIAERSNLGLGANAVGEHANNMPVSEGTMMFRAAAIKVANVAGDKADALSAAVAAGLGPHAINLNAQLQGLGLQGVVKQSLQDAVAAASSPAAALKPAFSLANLNQVPDNQRSSSDSKLDCQPSPSVLPAAAIRPPVIATAAAQQQQPASQQQVNGGGGGVPVVLGPHGRPLSPNRARKYLKEQQSALDREEERRRAVESALARLRHEKELREKQREDFKRMQERRYSAGVAGGAQPVAQASKPGVGIAGVGAAKVNVALGAGGILAAAAVPRPAAPASIGSSNAPSRVSVGQVTPMVAGGSGGGGQHQGFAANAVAAAAGANNRPGIVNINAAAPAVSRLPIRPILSALPSGGSGSSSSVSTNVVSVSGAAYGRGAGAAAAAGGSSSSSAQQQHPGADKAAELRERAAAIRREAVRANGVGASASANSAGSRSNVPSREPSPSHAGNPSAASAAGAALPRSQSEKGMPPSSGAAPGAADRQRVADLDSWEREKGISGGAAGAGGSQSARDSHSRDRQGAAAAGGPRTGVAALHAAAAQVAAAQPRAVSSSREPSQERGGAVVTGSRISAPSSAKPSPAAGPSLSAAAVNGQAMSDKASVASSVSSGSASAAALPGVRSVSRNGSVVSAGSNPSSVASSVVVSTNASGSVSKGPAAAAVASSSSSAGLASAAAAGSRSASSSGASAAPSQPQQQQQSASTPHLSAALPVGSKLDGLSARDRVVALKEMRRKAEEEAEKARLNAAAKESIADRARAQYLTREQYRGVGAAIAGALPIAAPVLANSVEDARELVHTLRSQLPGSRYDNDTSGSNNVSMASASADNSMSKEGEDGDGDDVTADLADQRHRQSRSRHDNDEAPLASSAHMVSGSPQNAGAAAMLVDQARDNDAAANAESSAPIEDVPSEGRYADGILPDSDDSEDDIILESAQDAPTDEEDGGGNGEGKSAESADSDGKQGDGRLVSGPGANRGLPNRRQSSNRSRSSTPAAGLAMDSGSEDENDISEVERELRQELARSTMRCNDLRKSLDVARIVAVQAGVQIGGSAAKALRRASGVSLTPVFEGREIHFDPKHHAGGASSSSGGTPFSPGAGGRPVLPGGARAPSSSQSAAGSSAGAAGADAHASISLPPSNYASNNNPADERPIRPSPGYGQAGYAALPPEAFEPSAAGASGAGATAGKQAPARAGVNPAAQAKPSLPPSGRPVLAPSAAATAAAGGYMSPKPITSGTGSAGPSPAASGGLPPAALAPTSSAGVAASGHARWTSSAAAVGNYDAPSLSQDQYYDDGENEEDEEDQDDDDDIGDEDGDEAGQVQFVVRQPGSAGRSSSANNGAGSKMHSGTIREEDEEEDEDNEGDDADADNEDDEDDDAFGGEFKSQLNLRDRAGSDQGGDAASTIAAPGHASYAAAHNRRQSASGAGASAPSSSSALGSLSSRVEDLRRHCMAGLGLEVFESVYAAVKAAMWDDAEAEMAGSTVGEPGEAQIDLSTLPAQLGLDDGQTEFVEDVVQLLHMEQDLL